MTSLHSYCLGPTLCQTDYLDLLQQKKNSLQERKFEWLKTKGYLQSATSVMMLNQARKKAPFPSTEQHYGFLKNKIRGAEFDENRVPWVQQMFCQEPLLSEPIPGKFQQINSTTALRRAQHRPQQPCDYIPGD